MFYDATRSFRLISGALQAFMPPTLEFEVRKSISKTGACNTAPCEPPEEEAPMFFCQ